MGCDNCESEDEFCVPSVFRKGWLGSSYVWIAILITIVIVTLIITSVSFNTDWFVSLVKPPGLIPQWGFYTIQYTVLFLILIGIIMATYSQGTKPMSCAIILYIFLISIYFLWLFGFIGYQIIGWSIPALVITILITLWISWLVTVPQNRAKGWFPMVTFMIFLVWLLFMLYYNISFAILNQ